MFGTSRCNSRGMSASIGRIEAHMTLCIGLYKLGNCFPLDYEIASLKGAWHWVPIRVASLHFLASHIGGSLRLRVRHLWNLVLVH